MRGRQTLVHRIAWEHANGPVPKNRVLDHLCRNRRCCNVKHMEVVTYRENAIRGESIPARYLARTHCDSGHEYNAENTYLRSDGGRRCRACKRAKYRESVTRVPAGV